MLLSNESRNEYRDIVFSAISWRSSSIEDEGNDENDTEEDNVGTFATARE